MHRNLLYSRGHILIDEACALVEILTEMEQTNVLDWRFKILHQQTLDTLLQINFNTPKAIKSAGPV